ncbi:MAG: BREX system serine/threonine kinase PglW [Pseudanabaena sp. M090S1SP1A06QC]|nr:BREX system serine/threonine kinase PglW [Pseudanabaena sp. M109S1SP1A06QC]MCA6604978.1 BREX system serine/threonine kinase PglW [Pseudanabaena sp. M007S1SP1A06QC]MCA6614645.1 BREX system serine/threonine kinase PglW [Pseudanabaena sp. M090S1SP1A06QC]
MTSSSNWVTVTESNFPWEKEAIEYVRQHFPTYEPYRAWSNFEFIASDGSINEVDLLVFTPQGVFLVEIKSHQGRLSGDTGTWQWENNGKSRIYDNPLILANSKAKKLRSLLASQKAFRGKYQLPFIEALVFCSAPDLKCDLKDNARLRICLRDRPATATKPMRSGIISALLKRDCLGLDEHPKGMHDRPTSKAFALAMEQAGIRPSQQQRRVSDYILKAQIGEGQGYQDWEADHVSLLNSVRRVRLYLVHSNWPDIQKKIAERAALREFRIVDSLQHPGILRTYGYTEHQLGSAIIFEHDPSSMRLDLYLIQHKDVLSVDIRLELLRQITEAIAYAHQKRVVHRALCPQSIFVVDLSRQRRQIKILNWQVGYREDSSSSGGMTAIGATSHGSVLVDDASKAYIAPESLSNISEGEHLDIFSLGAIAYHLFSGKPPASNGAELSNKLRATKGLQISGVIDGVGKELQELIQLSTHPDVSLRIDSTIEFLARLELVEEELTNPSEMEVFVEDPNLAQKGDVLAGRFEVLHRLGQGGSAIAFLVERDGQEFVIKVANDPEYNDRLRGEAEVLQKLHHEAIVEFRGLEMIGDRVAFLMNPIYVEKKADKRGDRKIETLRQRLRPEGRLHLELLERFGEDLLNAVRYLEDQKIYHRDIKPDNIAVGQVGRGDRLHAVLFDFSLSKVSLDNIRAGTTGYLDPLLPVREPPIWDSYAERYAAAITLYELATGTIPKWGDGVSDPSYLECEITIDAELFDLALRDSLPEFFAKAFRRNICDRFDNAEEMLREWRSCFEGLEPAGATLSEEDVANLQEKIAIATGDTPIAELGLGARALQVLDRHNIFVVKDLLSVQKAWLISLRGVGSKTRREIGDIVEQLRDKEIAEAELNELRSQDVADPSKLSIDMLVQRITRASGKGAPKAKSRWVKDAAIVKLRGDVAEILADVGLVMSLDEAAAAILVARGSYYDEPQRTKNAIAILQIVLEVEAVMVKPRFRLYDSSENLRSPLIAASQEAFDYAIALGQVADRLAQQDPLLPPSRAVLQLREIAVPATIVALSDGRLMRLAAVASREAALSSRQEFYPRGMDAGRALKLSQGALLGVPILSIAEIRDRIASRYPEAANIPDHPELDELLAAAGLDLIWDAKGANGWGCYVNRLLSPFLDSSSVNSFSRQPTATGTMVIGEVDEAAADARLFEEKLQRGLKQGAFFVILVQSRYYQQAIAEIANRLPVVHLSFEDLLLNALREVADSLNVNWDLVLETDARPYEGDWDKLLLLVDRALVLVNEQLVASDRTILLSHVGMLARYDRLNWVEHWRDRVGSEIAGLWVLVPGDRPFINGKAIPLMSPSQKTTMPKSWLENRHRAVN